MLDRELVEAVGRAEGLGRPLLYGTTRRFLEHFGFRSLEDLPRPDELPVILRAKTIEAAPIETPAHAAAAEPTPLSPDAAAEAEALHIPVPEELRSALEHREELPPERAAQPVALEESEAASVRDGSHDFDFLLHSNALSRSNSDGFLQHGSQQSLGRHVALTLRRSPQELSQPHGSAHGTRRVTQVGTISVTV